LLLVGILIATHFVWQPAEECRLQLLFIKLPKQVARTRGLQSDGSADIIFQGIKTARISTSFRRDWLASATSNGLFSFFDSKGGPAKKYRFLVRTEDRPQRLSPASYVLGNIAVLGRDRRRPDMLVRQQLPFVILCLLFFTPRAASLADNMRLCGEHLVKMMKIVCNNCFNGGSGFDIAQQKRDRTVGKSHTRAKNDEDCSFEVLTNRLKLKNSERRKRSRKGIVEECCIRSCSYTHMRSYCCS
ncbi:hypothetical protein M514_09000, partial [Trichuris suis]